MKLYEISKLFCSVTDISELRYRFTYYYSNAKHTLETIDEDILKTIFRKWEDHIVFVEPSEALTRVTFPDGVNDDAINLTIAWEKLFPETIVSVGFDLVDGEKITFVLGESFSSKELLKELRLAFKKAEFNGRDTMKITIDDLLELVWKKTTLNATAFKVVAFSKSIPPSKTETAWPSIHTLPSFSSKYTFKSPPSSLTFTIFSSFPATCNAQNVATAPVPQANVSPHSSLPHFNFYIFSV